MLKTINTKCLFVLTKNTTFQSGCEDYYDHITPRFSQFCFSILIVVYEKFSYGEIYEL